MANIFLDAKNCVDFVTCVTLAKKTCLDLLLDDRTVNKFIAVQQVIIFLGRVFHLTESYLNLKKKKNIILCNLSVARFSCINFKKNVSTVQKTIKLLSGDQKKRKP